MFQKQTHPGHWMAPIPQTWNGLRPDVSLKFVGAVGIQIVAPVEPERVLAHPPPQGWVVVTSAKPDETSVLVEKPPRKPERDLSNPDTVHVAKLVVPGGHENVARIRTIDNQLGTSELILDHAIHVCTSDDEVGRIPTAREDVTTDDGSGRIGLGHDLLLTVPNVLTNELSIDFLTNPTTASVVDVFDHATIGQIHAHYRALLV